jgi:hypothetical protein
MVAVVDGWMDGCKRWEDVVSWEGMGGGRLNFSFISYTSRNEWSKQTENKNTHKKLTTRPHARAGSMEVDGYENPTG